MTGISIKRAGDTVEIPEGCFALIMPVDRAHASCVALQPVPAGVTTSTATQTTRNALLKALARVQGQGR